MSKRSYRLRGEFERPFVMRAVRMLESPAFRALSLTGHRILACLEIELGRNAGQDNGKLIMTYDQFVKYGIHRHAIAPGLREAVALGFLEVSKQGRAGNREFRQPSEYRLTYLPVGRAKPTNEWQHMTPEQAETAARAARKPIRREGGKNRKPVSKTVTETSVESHH